MKGTSKQIGWATEIRGSIIAVMQDAIDTFSPQAAGNPIVKDNIDGLQERINRLSSDDVYAGDIIDLFGGVHLTGDCNADLGAVMAVYNVAAPTTTGQRWLLVKETKEGTTTTDTTTHTSVKTLWDEISSWTSKDTVLATVTDELGNEVNIILQTCRDASGKVVDNSVMAVYPCGTVYPDNASKIVSSAIKRVIAEHERQSTTTVYILQDADTIRLGVKPVVLLDEPPEVSRTYIRRLSVMLPKGYRVSESQDLVHRIYRDGEKTHCELDINADGDPVLLDASAIPASHIKLAVVSDGWDK